MPEGSSPLNNAEPDRSTPPRTRSPAGDARWWAAGEQTAGKPLQARHRREAASTRIEGPVRVTLSDRPRNRSPNARRRNSVVQRRRRCSGRSWARWQRWHNAARLRERLLPGSWSRCALASTTRVVGNDARPASVSKRNCRTTVFGAATPLTRRPASSRQQPRSASHQRPSPRCCTTCPCGRPHCSHRRARVKRTLADSSRQSIG